MDDGRTQRTGCISFFCRDPLYVPDVSVYGGYVTAAQLASIGDNLFRIDQSGTGHFTLEEPLPIRAGRHLHLICLTENVTFSPYIVFSEFLSFEQRVV